MGSCRGTTITAAVAALVIAGCGGDEADEPQVEFAAFEECVQGDPVVDVEVGSAEVDLIAGNAGEGALQLEWGETQFANVAVERSSDDAESTLDDYGEGIGEIDYFERFGNLVIGYANEPTESESALVEVCVSEASSGAS